MKTKLTQTLVLSALIALSSIAHSQTYTFNFNTFDGPLAGAGPGQGTWSYGISGNNTAGYYGNSDGGRHGFFYNGSSCITLDYPGISNFTQAFGVDGSNVVGMYSTSSYGTPNYGFLYNGSSYTSLNHPSANGVTIA